MANHLKMGLAGLLCFALAACHPTQKTVQKKMEQTSTTKGSHSVEWAKNANIYEVNVRQYTPEGTFKAFEKHIPRLKTMGVDVIWFMPIQPIGKENRKGSLGSYYSISDYKGINPEYGTLADFKSIVKTAHQNGMKVMIDWVANHTSWDNHWLKKNPEWYTHRDGKIIPPVDDWADVADLNFDNKEMRAAMVDALQYWVRETDIDGYRCDMAMMVPMDFWEQARPLVDKIKKQWWLAESEGPEFHTNAFDITYAWEAHHTFNDIAKGKKNANALDEFLQKQKTTYSADACRLHFTSNHDENSWNGTEYERMGDGAKVFAVLALTFHGTPLLYSGQEAAFNRRLKFFDKDQIDWGTYPLADFYQKLLELKHNNRALWNGEQGGELQRIETHQNDKVYAFVREKDGDKFFAVLNLSGEPQEVHLHGDIYKGTYRNIFTNNRHFFQGGETVKVGAWGYEIFSNK
jgi:glycosidase